jgi:hypothetical protein
MGSKLKRNKVQEIAWKTLYEVNLKFMFRDCQPPLHPKEQKWIKSYGTRWFIG